MSAYADTSFIASLYLLDANSEAAAAEMARAELPLFMTSFGELELANAVHLRVFRKELTKAKGRAALALFRRDAADGVYFLKPLSANVFEMAARLSTQRTPKLGTRTLDLLHVASALDLRAKTFYSFDLRQCALAAAAGLKTLP